jgi:uncharacterized membrane protein (DUF2068 family)
MSTTRYPVTYKGRSIGIVTLTIAQSLIGTIHVFSGFWLLAATLSAELIISAQSPVVYSVYTLIFGLLTLIFASGIWLEKRWGWIGTIAVSMFVVVADALTLAGLPSIPGIPQSAAVTEIAYSLIVVLYLFQPRVRNKYR